jgi:hypothetical protein
MMTKERCEDIICGILDNAIEEHRMADDIVNNWDFLKTLHLKCIEEIDAVVFIYNSEKGVKNA